jgi:cbb3-type cytochrome oxidase cytochrome c subunit
MPAKDETYRSLSNTHIVFAISSIVMTLVTVWMILDDHFRSWKVVQRDFYRIEQNKLKANEKDERDRELAKNKKDLEEIDRAIAEAKKTERKNARKIKDQQAKLDKILAEYTAADTSYKFQKAELDSLRSYYDEMIDEYKEAQAREFLKEKIEPAEAKLIAFTKQKQKIEADRVKADAEMEDLKGHLADLEKKRDAIFHESERIGRVLKQKEENANGIAAWIRSLPLIDLAAPPEKIKQIFLPELTINYNFKEVPRYDRCQTCHMAIDRPNYELDAEKKPLAAVYKTHPHLADGYRRVDPFTKKTSEAGLYLDANGPHPINYFGCTICHGGQGSGTDFTFASHEPNDLKQEHEWDDTYQFQKIHMWDYPMLPKRFVQSSCVKCHHEVTDIPQADKLQAGYNRIVKYGCTGCHTIGGQGSFGPDLTDAPKVGPNLEHIGSKTSKEWTLKWIKNPHAFRPDTRMPRFYGVTNNDAPSDQPKNDAEIHAITHYLFAKSTPPKHFVDPPTKGDPAKGKALFFQKGCLACHAHKDYPPSSFPAAAQEYAKANQGPNLSNIADKFQSNQEGYKWLTNWIHAPESYHEHSLMPNLQLSLNDSADIASWILTVKAEWARPVEVPAADSTSVKQAIDELISLYKGKSGTPLSQVAQVVKDMSQNEKLMYLGEKTISRLGCFGCHNIPGFETAKPIGTPLNGWGSKSPAKLDFAHILEYLEDQPIDDQARRDGTDLYYQEQLEEHTRSGFIFQKLHRPRSYDYKKTKEDLKTWDERLRMPQFTWADDPAAIEEVMTFVLGLTGEKIASRYLPHYGPDKTALARGTKLINRYNCKGCHVLETPEYTIAAGTKVKDALTQFDSNVQISYNGAGLSRNKDYHQLYPELKFDPDKPPVLTPDDASKPITISGMPVSVFENEVTVQLWRPVTIRGYTFNIGDQLTVDSTKVTLKKPDGGGFGWLQAYAQADKGADFASVWNTLPPPLLREGTKVQTPWLSAFLKDPMMIRPSAMLRMPRFHYADPLAETAELSNYFAAVDGAEFPYQDIPQREQSYLAAKESTYPDYLSGGWQLITKGACVQCHAIGQFKPTGGAGVIVGPELKHVGARFRPEYLTKWLGNPARLVPYTAMPQNISPQGPPPPGVPKPLENNRFGQVEAVRDTLLNYVDAVERQLTVQAGVKSPVAPADAKPADTKPAGGGR